MEQLRNQQRGMTFLGWLIILGLIGFFVLLALRLTPTFLENFTVKQQLSSLTEESGVGESAPVEIRKMLLRRLSIDDVDTIEPDDISVKKNKERVFVDVVYEVRTPLVGNIDACISFAEHVEFPIR